METPHGRAVSVGNQDDVVRLSRQRAGRCATDSCCRSTRTRRCSRCSAPLRRQRADQLRPSGPARARADPCRQRPYAGRTGGEEAHTLIDREIPTHIHSFNASHAANATTPCHGEQRCWPLSAATSIRRPANLIDARTAQSVTNVGGSQAHNNMQPFLTHQLLHRAAGHLPLAELRKRTMAQPYVGEIRMFAGNFAPAGWHVLRRTAAADLRKRDAVQADRHHLWRRRPEHLRPARSARPAFRCTRATASSSAETGGARGGHADGATDAAHTHPLLASDRGPATRSPPKQCHSATSASVQIYIEDIDGHATWMRAAVGSVGGSQPHSNIQPFLCVSFIISLFGIFPPPG